MGTKILILGIFVIIGFVSAYIIFNLPKNKINEDTNLNLSLNLSFKNNSHTQSISHIETKENSERKKQGCPKIDCPKVECPKCPEKVDDGKLIYIETYLNNTGNANLSDGRVKFYLKDSLRVESSLNNTFILNSSRHDRAKIIYEVNYSCEKCKECPPCRYESYYYGCVCPEPERRNVTNISCKNDTIADFNIELYLNGTPLNKIRNGSYYYQNESIEAKVKPNRAIYVGSTDSDVWGTRWYLYFLKNENWTKIHLSSFPLFSMLASCDAPCGSIGAMPSPPLASCRKIGCGEEANWIWNQIHYVPTTINCTNGLNNFTDWPCINTTKAKEGKYLLAFCYFPDGPKCEEIRIYIPPRELVQFINKTLNLNISKDIFDMYISILYSIGGEHLAANVPTFFNRVNQTLSLNLSKSQIDILIDVKCKNFDFNIKNPILEHCCTDKCEYSCIYKEFEIKTKT